MTNYLKNIIRSNWCLLLVASVLFSCEKEMPLIEQTNTETVSSTVGFRSTDFDGEILSFDSWEEMEEVVENLREQVEQHNEQFSAQYADLDDEAYNDLIDEQGFDEYLPLTQFEEMYGFYSKRQQLNELIESWLDASGELPQMEDYPDDFPILKQEMRSLFNAAGQIRIAGEVITVDDIPLSPEFYLPCAEEGSTRAFRLFNNNRNLIVQTTSVAKLRLLFSSIQVATSNIRTYRLNNRGRWRSLRANLQSEMRSVFRDSDCLERLPSTMQNQITISRGRRSSNSAGTAYRNPSFQQFKLGWCDMDGLGWANGQVARACIL